MNIMKNDDNRMDAIANAEHDQRVEDESSKPRKKSQSCGLKFTPQCHRQLPPATEAASNHIDPIPNSKTTNPNENTRATSFLLRLLTREIERDGGACLATTLKEYIVADHGPREPLQVKPLSSLPTAPSPTVCYKSSKKRNHQLNSLLTQSNIGKPKLLAFLESHPDVFSVDRTTIPHWVRLVAPGTTSIDGATTSRTASCVEVEGELRNRVFQKALYVLRKRKARMDRRRTKASGSNRTELDADAAAAAQTRDSEDPGVFCHWLLRQCSWEFHFFLRYNGFYMDPKRCGYKNPCDVKQVGSRAWEDVTLKTFECTLCVDKDERRMEDRGDSYGGEPKHLSWIHVENGKAFLKQSSVKERNHHQTQSDEDDAEGVDPTACEKRIHERPMNHKDDTNDDSTLRLVRRIDQILTEIVCRKDGGHQVSLQLILHRYPGFKELLGGRDLWTMYCDFSNVPDVPDGTETVDRNDSIEPPTQAIPKYFFQAITIIDDGQNLILRSKRPKTNNSCSSGSGDDDHSLKGSKDDKRMKVDEEGLYSVTNNKWGRAMSNLVIQGCRETNLYGNNHFAGRVCNHGSEEQVELIEQNENLELHSEMKISKTVIDLTASVGGMTLALARSNFFDRVIALEIDQVRANLCRENLGRYGFRDGPATSGRSVVEIRHSDSVQQIPSLPRGACFVIDPPWGGWDYKGKVRRHQQLKLGDTPLEDVLVKISHHNAPCIVGLRLPTNFLVQDFLTALTKKEEPAIDFACLRVRKIAVQLFVVLSFPSPKPK